MRLKNLGWLSAVFLAGAVVTAALLKGHSALEGAGRDLYATRLLHQLREPITLDSARQDERFWLTSCRSLAAASGLNASELGAAALDLGGALRREIDRQVVRDAWERLSLLEKLRTSISGPDDVQIERAGQKHAELRKVTKPARIVADVILPCGTRTDIDAPERVR